MATMPRIDCALPLRLMLHTLIIALLLGAACESKKEPAAEKPARLGATPPGSPPQAEMVFDVDPALLGLSYADSSVALRFSPPRGWPPLEPELFDAAKEAFTKLARVDRFTSRPVRMFSDGEKRFFLIVSEFPHWPPPLDPYVAFADYARELQGPMTSLDIQQAFYKHGALDMYHLVIGNAAMVNHRVIVLREGRVPVQVDYLIPSVAYSTTVKAIEASIGSFQAL